MDLTLLSLFHVYFPYINSFAARRVPCTFTANLKENSFHFQKNK